MFKGTHQPDVKNKPWRGECCSVSDLFVRKDCIEIHHGRISSCQLNKFCTYVGVILLQSRGVMFLNRSFNKGKAKNLSVEMKTKTQHCLLIIFKVLSWMIGRKWHSWKANVCGRKRNSPFSCALICVAQQPMRITARPDAWGKTADKEISANWFS